MDCFIKSIENSTDHAVDWNTALSVCLPVTIVSISGFGTKPTSEMARFLVEFCCACSEAKKGLIVCRNAPITKKDSERHLSSTFCTLASTPIETPSPNWWNDCDVHFSSIENVAQISATLHRDWQLPYGNWLLVDSPINPESIIAEFCRGAARSRNISDLRAILLDKRGFAACTFDNKLFDLLVNKSAEHVNGIVVQLAQVLGLPVSLTSSG